MFVGLWTPIATATTAAVLVDLYVDARVGGSRGFFAYHHQALLTAVTALMVAAPSGRSLSLDRWLALRRAAAAGLPPPQERGALWAQRLIALQVSAVYLWSVVDKLSPDHLSGARLERIVMHHYTGSDLPTSAALSAAFVVAAWAVIAVEAALGIGLWWRSARRLLVPLGVLFHAALFLTLPVCVFSALMVLLYLAYADPDAVAATIDRLLGGPAAQVCHTPTAVRDE